MSYHPASESDDIATIDAYLAGLHGVWTELCVKVAESEGMPEKWMWQDLANRTEFVIGRLSSRRRELMRDDDEG